MPYKNLNDIPPLTGVIVFLMGLWGALVNFVHRSELDTNISITQKITYFCIDLLSSGGIACITFLTLVGYGFNELLAVGVSGVAAHQGTKTIYFLELFFIEKLKSGKSKETIENKKEKCDE